MPPTLSPREFVPQQLSPRQSDNCSCPNSLSSGAIAGIVLGTIAGTLLIIWLIRSCFLPGAPGNRQLYGTSSVGPSGGSGGRPVLYSSTASPPPSSHRRRRSHYRTTPVATAAPGYVEYVEKSEPVRVARSRTRRGSVASVSRPERVYVSSS